MTKEDVPPYERYLPWVAALAIFMQSLDGTILNTSLPSIAVDMNYSPLEMQSIIVSYTLTLALFIPLSGWLSDRFGSKCIFILAVALFTLGSALCAASFDLLTMNCSRIIQGIGASMMVPVARLAILYQFPRRELLRVMNLITTLGLLGLVIGPSLGGWMSDHLSWHWVFLVNIPIGIIGIFMAKFIMPNFRNKVGRFDGKGLMFFSLALILITLAMELSSSSIMDNWQLVFTLVVFSGVLFWGYYKHFKKVNNPIIDINLFKIRTLKVGLIGGLITRFGISGLPFLLPLLFQVGFGYSPTVSGLLLLPSSITTIAVKPLIVPLVNRWGYRKILISNTLFLAVIILTFSLMNQDTPLEYSVFLMIAYGAFTSIQMASMNTITLSDITDDQASGANSMLAIMQQLAISFGISIAAMVLSFYKELLGDNKEVLVMAFKYTLITLAIFTALSCLTFTKLKPDDGSKVLKKNRA